jgi:hypothetical protein
VLVIAHKEISLATAEECEPKLEKVPDKRMDEGAKE